MNSPQKYFFKSIPLIGVILFTILALTVGRQHRISQINTLKSNLKKRYLSAQYDTVILLVDSLSEGMKVKEEALKLNRAHAAFLNFRSRHNFSKLDSSDVDSVRKSHLTTYTDLANTLTDEKMASIAFNQSGLLNYKQRDTSNLEAEDQILERVAEDFKAAIEKDPTNTMAIYNYELIYRKMGFPTVVLNQMRKLVASHQYIKAQQIFSEASTRDRSIEKRLEEYKTRLDLIVMIDTLKTQKP